MEYFSQSQQLPHLDNRLAKREPDKFISILKRKLAMFSPEIVDIIHQLKNVALISDNFIEIDPHTYYGQARSSAPEISLGTAPLSKRLREWVHYQPEIFADYEAEVMYRLLHEINHKLLGYLINELNYTEIGDLYSELILERSHSGYGYSKLGSNAYYRKQGPEVQAKEDCVELLTMKLFSEDLFHDFIFHYIGGNYTELTGELDYYRLARVDTARANHLYHTITNATLLGGVYVTGNDDLLNLTSNSPEFTNPGSDYAQES